jgi:hypothetical protein
VDQLQRELEAARLAIVSLLAVMTDEQWTSVETALQALQTMSDTTQAALNELRHVRSQLDAACGGEQIVSALEERLRRYGQKR